MKVIHPRSLVFSLRCSVALPVCSAEPEFKPKTASSIVVNTDQIEFENGETESVVIAASEEAAQARPLRGLPTWVEAEGFRSGKLLVMAMPAYDFFSLSHAIARLHFTTLASI